MTMAEAKKGQVLGSVLKDLPTDALANGAKKLVSAAGQHALSMAGDKAGQMTDRLLDYVENGPMGKNGEDADENGGGGDAEGNGGGGGKKGGRGGKKLKLTNIVEEIDVGVPLRVAYNQWTQFQDFPKFTKRLETVEQESDEKLTWKAGIFLSHRTWQSTIVEQVPDELIVWRSKGQKGHVDGAVTFHELAPNLTRILVVLEYHPQGLFERTGNIWRAQGRRARLELKHFRRHVMTQTILDPDEVEGWRGEIRDGEVVRTHEEAMEEEEQARQGEEGDEEEAYDEEDEGEDEEARDEDERDYDEDELDDSYEDEEEPDEEEPEEDEADDSYEDEEEPDEDDERGYDDEEEEPEQPVRSRSRRVAARGR
jgi:hypothetical protein